MTKLTVHAVQKTLKASIGKLAHARRVLMFSGGFDSMLLALLAKSNGARVTAVTVRFEDFNPLTVAEATLLAQRMRLPHYILDVTLQEFLSAFGSLPLLTDKPMLDLDLVLVHAALKKYDSKIAGKVFISGMGSDQWFGDKALDQAVIDEGAHQKVAQAQGYKFIFPFLSTQMLALSQQIPAALKVNKKLLRAMVTDTGISTGLLSGHSGRREIQVPEQVRHLLVKVYSRCKLGNLMTKHYVRSCNAFGWRKQEAEEQVYEQREQRQ